MVNEKKLDEALRVLGHDVGNEGTEFIREAVIMRGAGAGRMCKDVYPGIAAAHGVRWTCVERNMRHSLDKAWGRCSEDQRNRFFGSGVRYASGRPALGEYVATLARICREDVEI